MSVLEKHKVEWEAVFGLDTLGKFPTFKQAVHAEHTAINESLSKGGMGLQVLEEATWIREVNSDHPIHFYDFRDIAAEMGWIKDGKWVETA